VNGAEVLREALARERKDLVFAMIQKYRGEVLDADSADEDADADRMAPDFGSPSFAF
jgi:hypothetical protein